MVDVPFRNAAGIATLLTSLLDTSRHGHDSGRLLSRTEQQLP